MSFSAATSYSVTRSIAPFLSIRVPMRNPLIANAAASWAISIVVDSTLIERPYHDQERTGVSDAMTRS